MRRRRTTTCRHETANSSRSPRAPDGTTKVIAAQTQHDSAYARFPDLITRRKFTDSPSEQIPQDVYDLGSTMATAAATSGSEPNLEPVAAFDDASGT